MKVERKERQFYAEKTQEKKNENRRGVHVVSAVLVVFSPVFLCVPTSSKLISVRFFVPSTPAPLPGNNAPES